MHGMYCIWQKTWSNVKHWNIFLAVKVILIVKLWLAEGNHIIVKEIMVIFSGKKTQTVQLLIYKLLYYTIEYDLPITLKFCVGIAY